MGKYSYKGFLFLLVTTLSLSLIVACGGSKSAKSNNNPNKTQSSSYNKKADKAIATARTYIGTPYKYGGTTKKGIDCSGLMCTSYKSANVNLPRTSSAQSQYGKSVKMNELQPGDLVFFSARKGSKKITHVGMVTTVKNKSDVRFIHASSSRGVVEDNLMSDYYQGVYVKATRPF